MKCLVALSRIQDHFYNMWLQCSTQAIMIRTLLAQIEDFHVEQAGM